MNAFLDGYRAESEFDPRLLARSIALRVGQSYAYWFASKRGRPTLAGLPIARKRVQRLLNELLADESANAIQNISGNRTNLHSSASA